MDDKVFFNPGQAVVVKHEELDNRPVMIVIGKKAHYLRDDMSSFRSSEGSTLRFESKGAKSSSSKLLGIECFWFNEIGDYLTALFNTKDLIHYEAV